MVYSIENSMVRYDAKTDCFACIARDSCSPFVFPQTSCIFKDIDPLQIHLTGAACISIV